MIRNIKILALLMTILTKCFSQSDTLLFKYWKKEHISYITCVDTITYTGYGGAIPRNSYIAINTKSFSSTKDLIPKSKFILNNEKVYFLGYLEKNNSESLCHFQKSNFIKDCEFSNYNYLALTKDSFYMAVDHKYYSKSYNKCNESAQIIPKVDIGQNREFVEIETLPDGTSMYVFAVMEQGYTDFLYIVKNKKYTRVIDASREYNDPNFLFEIPFVNEKAKVYYGKTIRMDMNKNKEIRNDVLINEKFKIYTTVLKKNKLNTESVKGYNYFKGQMYSYNIASITDDGKESIISYKFMPELELAMKKIYLDSLINDTELSRFGYYELKCLSNILLAKHNIAFDSKYFQSYFNLFNFYNSPVKRKARNSTIEQLLTENDKQNLKVLQKRMQPFEVKYKNFKIN